MQRQLWPALEEFLGLARARRCVSGAGGPLLDRHAGDVLKTRNTLDVEAEGAAHAVAELDLRGADLLEAHAARVEELREVRPAGLEHLRLVGGERIRGGPFARAQQVPGGLAVGS